MTLAALAALIGCSAAGAEPAASSAAPQVASSALPAGWKPLPAVAAAVTAAAKADGIAVDGVEAAGEPARGCYRISLALHAGAATAPELATQILASFDTAPATGAGRSPSAAPVAPPVASPSSSTVPSATGSPSTAQIAPAISISELITPTDPIGELSFRFTQPPYRGRVQAHLGSGRIAAVACFANQREPAACEAACTRLLQPGGVR